MVDTDRAFINYLAPPDAQIYRLLSGRDLDGPEFLATQSEMVRIVSEAGRDDPLETLESILTELEAFVRQTEADYVVRLAPSSARRRIATKRAETWTMSRHEREG